LIKSRIQAKILVIADLLNDRVVVLWSGGLDSTGLIKIILDKYEGKVFPIFLKHGQRNEEFEYQSVKHYTEIFKAKFGSRFHEPFIATSAIPAPEFKYFKSRIMLRNSDLINNAVRFAAENEIPTILIATFHYDMADGQKQFFEAKENEITIATGKKIKVFSPFFDDEFPCMTKTQVIDYCKTKGFDLSFTRSCYQRDEKPCGKCDACKIRKEAQSKSISDF